MQPADYNSYSYYQFPQNANPTPTSSDQHPNHLPSTPYASAPPFSINYPPSDASSPYSSTYPPQYSQNSDHIPSHNPPTAPSYPQNPNFQSFTPPTQSPMPTFPPFEGHGSYQPPAQQQPYYPSCDKHQSAPNYAPPAPIPSNPNPSSNPPPPSMYPSQYSQLGSSLPPVYDIPFESNVKFDRAGGYLDEPSGRYGVVNQSRSEFGSYVYGKPPESRMPRYDSGGFGNDAYGDDGVYAYQGKVEPYGARGTAPQSSTWSGFDDFGRPIGGGYSSSKERVSSPKIAKAVPKADTQQDVKGGIQKFRVKLLAESGGQSTMDVLCQIGLDGIRMLDPSTNRLLRVYPLDTITRCEVSNPSTLSFWSKSSVDIEPRRIRLQSNSYTTNTLLDTITAATVQFKEIGGRSRPSESSKMAEQPPEKKKGLADWMNLVKPVNEEKDHWVPDEAVTKCTACGTDFGAFNRKHHCRNCGDIFCDKCTHGRIALTADENAPQVRVCDRCMAEVTQRLSNAKETVNKSTGLQSHEDLAKKLQEEMEKNRRTASGSNSDGSGRRMKEVACPTCTVHLQVQVPSSGSETIECGVCQHPFLVSAR